MGRHQTAIGTLVERRSRYVMLFPLPDGNTAEAVRTALAETVQRLPELRSGILPATTAHNRLGGILLIGKRYHRNLFKKLRRLLKEQSRRPDHG